MMSQRQAVLKPHVVATDFVLPGRSLVILAVHRYHAGVGVASMGSPGPCCAAVAAGAAVAAIGVASAALLAAGKIEHLTAAVH